VGFFSRIDGFIFFSAEATLDELEEKWGDKYSVVIKSWRRKWQMLWAYFKYPDCIRTAIMGFDDGDSARQLLVGGDHSSANLNS